MIQGSVSRFAISVLGGSWLVLGTLKALDPDRARVMETILPTPLAAGAAFLVCGLELLLGAALLVGRRRIRSAALATSLLLLFSYGTWALIQQPQRCGCAGRLADLSPLAHALLTAGMLALTGIAMSRSSLTQTAETPADSTRRYIVAGSALLGALGAFLLSAPPPVHKPPLPTIVQLDVTDAIAPPHLLPADRPLANIVETSTPPETPSTAAEQDSSALILKGVVVDHTETAVADVLVWINIETAPPASTTPASTRTNAKGLFELNTGNSARLGLDTIICAEAPGRVPLCGPVSALERDHRGVVLKLKSGLSVRGVVRDPQGQPIEGARVQARGEGSEDLGWKSLPVTLNPRLTPQLASTLSKADGSFIFHGLLDADFNIVAAKEGYASPSIYNPQPPIRPGAVAEIQLVLEPLYSIRLLAVDDTDGSPISSAQYAVMHPQGKPWWSRVEPYGLAGSVPTHRELVARGPRRVVSQEFALAAGGDGTQVVRIRVYAPGYETTPGTALPVPASAATTTEVRLKRRQDTAPVIFTTTWASGQGVTGEFLLQLARQGPGPRDPQWYPIALIDGVSVLPLLLPAGKQRFSIRGSGGGFTAWTAPLGKDTNGRAMLGELDLLPGVANQVSLNLKGGGILVAPRFPNGSDVSEFLLSQKDGAGFSLRTWDMVPALERHTRGEVTGYLFWMSSGKKHMFASRPGYRPTDETVEVPEDGSVVVWRPTLTKE